MIAKCHSFTDYRFREQKKISTEARRRKAHICAVKQMCVHSTSSLLPRKVRAEWGQWTTMFQNEVWFCHGASALCSVWDREENLCPAIFLSHVTALLRLTQDLFLRVEFLSLYLGGMSYMDVLCLLLLIMNNLLLAAITESKLSQPDSCPSPGQLLCMCPSARAGWCAGTPKQPFRPHGTCGSGTQVLLGQHRGCSYCVVESYKQLVNLQRTLFPEPFCLPWRFLDACACSNPALTLTPNVSASLSLCWSSKSSHFHVHVESPCLHSLQNDLWTVELHGCRIRPFALLSSVLKFSWCVIGLTVACQSYDTTEHFITSRDRYHFHLCWLLLSAFEGKSRK